MKSTKRKSGGIMIMVMIVLLTVSFLTVGFFKLQETDAVEAVYVEQSSQAFWLAEAGMQRALDKLRKSKPYRMTPTPLIDSFGNGSYVVDVTAGVTPSTWNIVSTGTVQNVLRIVTLNPLLTAEAGYALMGLNGNSRLDKNGTVDDDIYSYGKLTANGFSPPTINGEVLALDSRNIDYTPLTENDRVEIDIDAPITDFSTAVGTPPTFIDVEYPIGSGITNTYLDLTGAKTVKVDADYDFEIFPSVYAEGTYGDGTLIVDGDLAFKNSGDPFVIGNAGTVYVDGDIWAGKDGTFGDNTTVYATGAMTLQKASGSASTTFLIEGDLAVNKDLDFNGLIFAEGAVTVDGDMDLKGSLIAGEGFWLKGGYNVEYDASQIPQDILDKMVLYVTYSTKPGTWNEIPVP